MQYSLNVLYLYFSMEMYFFDVILQTNFKQIQNVNERT